MKGLFIQGGRRLQGPERGKGERADKREVDRWKTERWERGKEWVRVRRKEDQRLGLAAVWAHWAHTHQEGTWLDMPAQPSWVNALHCHVVLAWHPLLLQTQTHAATHAHIHVYKLTNKSSHPQLARSLIRTLPVSYLDTHSFADKHTLAHTQNAMVLARTGRAGEGPGLMETPNSLL